MQIDTSFTMVEYACIVTRLKDELREGLREFRESPRTYITSSFRRDASGARRTNLLRLGLAFGLLVYATAFSLMLIVWTTTRSTEQAIRNTPIIICRLPVNNARVDLPADHEDAGGGGGGGNETNTRPSAGNLPAPSQNPILAPKPEDQTHPPALPVIEAIMLDPRISIVRDDLLSTGVPDGVPGPPSAGPGSNSGIGTGLNGGIGPGSGPGYGPGNGGNTGDGYFQIGGKRRPGDQQTTVDARPVLLNHPQPLYTEDARKNKIQGVVKVRILVDENGGVRQVLVTRGLADGLSEQAILAAYQMRFRPAMKNGHAVSYWIPNVEIEFNLR